MFYTTSAAVAYTMGFRIYLPRSGWHRKLYQDLNGLLGDLAVGAGDAVKGMRVALPSISITHDMQTCSNATLLTHCQMLEPPDAKVSGFLG